MVKVKSTYQQLILYIVLWGILLIPNIFALAWAEYLHTSFVNTAGYILLTLACLFLPALFLRARTYFILEGVLCIFFAPIEIASLHLNHRSTSDLFLQSVFATNPQEAFEVLTSVSWLCVIVVVVWIAYFVLSTFLKNDFLLPSTLRKIGCGGVLIFFAVLYGVMWFGIKHATPQLSFSEISAQTIRSVSGKFDKIYPYNIYRSIRFIIQDSRKSARLQSELTDFSFGIQRKDSLPNELYILFIGESSRYDHWALNGYERNTTPLLSAQNHLVSYSSVYSQANLTMYSVPLLLTRATADTPDIQYHEKCITDAFSEAGYYTTFITRNETTPLIRRAMSDCNYSYAFPQLIDIDFANDCDSYDMDMLTQAKEAYTPSAAFMVFHSMGSHYKYSLRYPVSDNYFTPSFGRTDGYQLMNESHKQLIINAYDNSIRYTDKVLDSLIAWVDTMHIPAVVMYIADHGESFWDDQHKFSMHGSYIPVEAEYHVPFFVWYSDAYAQKHADKVQSLIANRHTPVTSQIVFHSLLDLADIRSAADSTLSICSPYLSPQDTIAVLCGSGELYQYTIPSNQSKQQ